MPNIDFRRFEFHPVIQLPDNYEVYDFTRGYDPNRPKKSEYGIGKYDEKRIGMYTTSLFGGVRNIHVGIDISAPVGTPIHAFYAGTIHLFAYNEKEGDYGYTLITKHSFDGMPLYALYGHLNAASVAGKKRGSPVSRGEVIAWVGDRHENGGWNPHLHFQLSYDEPLVCDMPGVVTEEDRASALAKYPDPQLILGKLY